MWGILRVLEDVKAGRLRKECAGNFRTKCADFFRKCVRFSHQTRKLAEKTRKNWQKSGKNSKKFGKSGKKFGKMRAFRVLFFYPPARIVRNEQFAVLSV